MEWINKIYYSHNSDLIIDLRSQCLYYTCYRDLNQLTHAHTQRKKWEIYAWRIKYIKVFLLKIPLEFSEIIQISWYFPGLVVSFWWLSSEYGKPESWRAPGGVLVSCSAFWSEFYHLSLKQGVPNLPGLYLLSVFWLLFLKGHKFKIPDIQSSAPFGFVSWSLSGLVSANLRFGWFHDQSSNKDLGRNSQVLTQAQARWCQLGSFLSAPSSLPRAHKRFPQAELTVLRWARSLQEKWGRKPSHLIINQVQNQFIIIEVMS